MREPFVRNEDPQPDLTPFEGVAGDTWLDGKVDSLARFGAFVKLAVPGTEEFARGLVHASEISEDYIEYVEDKVKVGDSVKVRIVNVNVPDGKLALSMIEKKDEEDE